MGNKKTSEKGFSSYMIAAFLFLIACQGLNYFFESLGNSRIDDYYDYYAGSASHTEIPVCFQATEIIDIPSKEYRFEVLRFGYNLSKVKEVKVKFTDSSIDTNRIGHIFFNPGKFKISADPNKAYFALLDIRSNYRSFLFQKKIAFQIYSLDEFKISEVPSGLQKDNSWYKRVFWYSTWALVQSSAFFMFIFVAYPMADLPVGSPVRIQLFFTSLLIMAIYLFSAYQILETDKVFLSEKKYNESLLMHGIGAAIMLVMFVYFYVSAFVKKKKKTS